MCSKSENKAQYTVQLAHKKHMVMDVHIRRPQSLGKSM